MATILEALAVIKGKDATGGAFDAVAQKIGRISRAANALNRDVQKQLNLAAGAERAAARVQRGSSMLAQGGKLAAGAAATYGAGRAVSALAHETVKAGSDRAHEKARMSASGMTEDEIKQADELAGSISKKYPSLSQTSMMHMARNIRSLVGTYEEATKVLDPLAKLKVVAMGAHPEKAEELEADFDKLAKGMEIKGVTQHEEKFKHYMDGLAKALNVFGDTLRPTDYYEMFQYGRAATNALSDEFMLKTAPTIAQEFRGGGAGTALSGFHQQFVGGIMKHYAVKQLADLGMIDKSKVEFNKVGDVKRVKPGFMKVGAEFLQPGHEDPYAWTQAAVAHLRSKGKSDEEIQQLFTSMSSKATVAQLLNTFFLQKARIEKDWELVRKAKGLEAADDFQKNDPKVIRKSIEAQVDNVLGNTADAFQAPVNKGLNWLTSGLSYMSERAKKDPVRSAAELGFGAGLASALSADGTMGAASKFGIGPGSLGLTRLMGALGPILEVATRKGELVEPSAALKAIAGLHADKFNALADIAASERAGDIYGHDDPAYDAQLKALNDAKRAKIEAELADIGYGPAGLPGRGQMASQWTVADVQKATGIGGGEQQVNVSVEGNPTVQGDIKVSPSSEFWATIETKINNAMLSVRQTLGSPSKGTAGSTGTSMPEAGAPQ